MPSKVPCGSRVESSRRFEVLVRPLVPDEGPYRARCPVRESKKPIIVVARTDVQAGVVPREYAALNDLAHLPFSFGAPLYGSA